MDVDEWSIFGAADGLLIFLRKVGEIILMIFNNIVAYGMKCQ